MRALIPAAILLIPALAAAEPKTAVAGSGDCTDAELAQAVRKLSTALTTQPVKLVTEAEAQKALGRGPTRSVEEIQRQIEGARQHFYQAKYHRAVQEIEAVQAEIQRMAPGNDRWGLWVAARIIEGLIRTRLKGDGGTEEAFRAVLRLEPGYQLDTDYYGPSTLALFERVRKQLAQTKRQRLVVKSTPPGADVFLDGRKVGTTPYNATHIPGTYQLVVGRGDAHSLPRDLEIGTGQNEVHVDLRFEGALDTSRVTCISQPADDSVRLAQAVKLGVLLEADQVVVLRLDRLKGAQPWLAATLVGVKGGERIREGGMHLKPEGVTDQAMKDLAQFVATGEAPPTIKQDPLVDPEPPPPTTPDLTASRSPSPAPAWKRPAGQVLTGVGAALLVGGGVTTGLGASARAEYDAFTRNPNPEDAVIAREALDRSRVFLPVGYTGLGLGAVAAGVGAYLWLTTPPASSGSGSSSSDAPSITVLPTGPNAAQVTLSGSF